MKKLNLCIAIICFASNLTIAQSQDSIEENLQRTRDYYNSLINNKNDVQVAQLNMFFTIMPKGADLHHHYTGTIYAETFLDWVQEKNWRINKTNLKIVKETDSTNTNLITVEELIKNSELYRKLLTLWSDKDYDNHYHNQPPPDQNFFNTFGYFGTVSDQFMSKGLQIIKQRAVNENVQYIETMLSSVGVSSKSYPNRSDVISRLRKVKSQKEADIIFEEISKNLKKDKSFNSEIKQFVKNAKTVHNGIDDKGFTMRFQSYAARVQDPLEVYVDLLAAFKASDKSKLIVGVNIVAPENNTTALLDYTLHMQMFNYLSRKYPKTNRALHAGELTLGMVRPKNLDFHIHQAIDIAHAERIGHGIDVVYENNSIALLEKIKKNAVVEINLTSNEFILGVKGNAHPYTVYASYGVPMVISTDDSGVSRNNLTNEYMLLASRYKPSYDEIKKYTYNAIKYSFLSDKEKEANIKILDQKYKEFETQIAVLSSSVN
ncbi:amidohydrolase family protein [Flavicella marina]|uniref:adenosine deaminase n=1 Tax=Flavicella marina TaxID=1475951 RepID=UPI001264DA5D|nr:adenosine deaminase [Flavicella marina]